MDTASCQIKVALNCVLWTHLFRICRLILRNIADTQGGMAGVRVDPYTYGHACKYIWEFTVSLLVPTPGENPA